MEEAHGDLGVDLVEEGAADEAWADDADAQGQRGEVESAMHRTQRPNAVLLVDQHRYVVLAAPLRDRPVRSILGIRVTCRHASSSKHRCNRRNE